MDANLWHLTPTGWKNTLVKDTSSLHACETPMQTHHLSLGARGQRYMWATATCLKVTAPDRSNLFHPRQRAWWMRLSSFYQCPCPRSRIDGRGATWRAVPTSCLPGSQTCIQEITCSSKQTRLTEKLICWNLIFNIFSLLYFSICFALIFYLTIWIALLYKYDTPLVSWIQCVSYFEWIF